MFRQLLATGLAAFLALSLVADRTSAKPPDLPDNEPIIVSAPDESRPVAQNVDVTDYCPFSHSSTGWTMIPQVEPKSELIRHMPCLEDTIACPYRPCTQADRRAITDADVASLPSVLDNLRALEKAGCAIETARKLGQAGKVSEALEQLDEARKLCPGSRMVHRAEEVRNELTAVKAEVGTDEVQEDPICPEGGCCCPMAGLNNCGMCWMARICGFYDEVQKTACPCGRCEKGIPTTISLNCKDTPLIVVIGELKAQQVPVIVDLAALQARGISPHRPITISIKEMPAMAGLAILGRPLGLEPRVCGEGFCLTSPAVPGCGPGVPANRVAEEASEPAPRESACPKCATLHRQAIQAQSETKATGVEEQVNGLMKACYLAVGDGRTAKAADLAREAHALDPKRVEADPLIYKLHLLPEKEQSEPAVKDTESQPEADNTGVDPVPEQMTGSILFGLGINSSGGLVGSIVLTERNFDVFRVEDKGTSLQPDLPAVDPEIVPALDAVLTTPAGQRSAGGEEQSEEDSCCSIAKQLAWQALTMVFDFESAKVENGFLKLGLTTTGDITFYSLSKYAGMKILVFYRSGFPVIYVQPEGEQNPIRQASATNE